MSEVTDKKWLQVRLEVGLWKRLAHWSVEQGCTVSELVRRVLVKECEVHGLPEVMKGSQVERKPGSVRSSEVKKVEVPAGWSEPHKASPGATKLTTEGKINKTISSLTGDQSLADRLSPVDPKTCKHYFLPGNRACVKCGTVPPIVG